MMREIRLWLPDWRRVAPRPASISADVAARPATLWPEVLGARPDSYIELVGPWRALGSSPLLGGTSAMLSVAVTRGITDECNGGEADGGINRSRRRRGGGVSHGVEGYRASYLYVERPCRRRSLRR